MCVVCAIGMMWLMMAAAGCTDTGEPANKVADLEFTVVPEAEIPEELAKLIREKKANEFKLSYSVDGKLYIVSGFGEKDTGGYSVRVNALYLTENAIVFDTDLLGPAKDEEVSQGASWPYIVICTADRPESVIFR
ncbi:MAG: protease complex subunit PrcB family protein [Lachnospiraceae bacterium]|nr:protease complex subunit PrcB family protein [Lachnospiraceae bacterium]